MKKLVAVILVLALCLSLCSVAFAQPTSCDPCTTKIVSAIGTYWVARTIVENLKTAVEEMPDLAQFLKNVLPVVLPVGLAAVSVGILFAMLKNNDSGDEMTVADILNTKGTGMWLCDDGGEANDAEMDFSNGTNLIAYQGSSWETAEETAKIALTTVLNGSGNTYTGTGENGTTWTFTMSNDVLNQIVLGLADDSLNGTYHYSNIQ